MSFLNKDQKFQFKRHYNIILLPYIAATVFFLSQEDTPFIPNLNSEMKLVFKLYFNSTFLI